MPSEESKRRRKKALDRKRDLLEALTLWELARSSEPATFDLFARMRRSKRGTDAGKQAFYRWARWCRAHGLEVGMEGNAASFDRELAAKVARRVHPGLHERRPRQRTAPRDTQIHSRPVEPLLAVKEVARLLGRRREFVWRLLRSSPPPFPFVRVGRVITIRWSAVQAWLERHTVGEEPPEGETANG